MRITKKGIIGYGCALLSLICVGVLTAVNSSLCLESQMAAERWEGDGTMNYAQVSVFMGKEAGFDTTLADGIAETIDAAMVTASLEAPSEDARLWYYACSTPIGTLPVSGNKNNSGNVLATAVGGDFFTMHPMTLLDGSYISPNDLMKDRAVLDELAAWQLFGSSKVSGREFILNDQRCIVAGVIRQESDYATDAAYGETARIYISYDFYAQMQSGGMTGDAMSAEMTSDMMGMTQGSYVGCYEAVLPDPVRNFALNTVTDAFGTRDCMHIIRNTDRNSLSRRWKNLCHIHDMVISVDSTAYPYWENAARIMDYDSAVLLGAQIFFMIYPVLCALHLLWKGYKWLNRFISDKRKAHKNRYRSAIPQI